MTRRLGRRLLAIVALGLAVGLAVPCWLLIDERAGARESVRDERLSRTAFNALFQITVRQGRGGSINIQALSRRTRATRASR